MIIIEEQTTGSFGLDHKNLPERAFFSFQELYEEGLHVEKQAKIQWSQILPTDCLIPFKKSKFMKLNYCYIEYVIDCLHKNTTKVQNIKKYLLAALFNAPTTMDGYYTAEVNHDMPQFAVNH